MTQALKKLMLLAFVFAIASAAPKMTFTQVLSSLDENLRPHFTIRTDKGLKGGLSGAKGLIAMLALNRMAANESTGFTTAKEAVAAYAHNINLTKPACGFESISPAVVARSVGRFTKSFVTDMNPFGSKMVDNQSEIDGWEGEIAKYVAEQERIKGETHIVAKTFLSEGLPTTIQRMRERIPAYAQKRKLMFVHKQVVGKDAYALGAAPCFFAIREGKADKGRAFMAWATIASVVYTAANTVRDYRDAKAAKAAAAKPVQEETSAVA